jgi:prepilin-type N-terminal cleavage/methylation domain-containing protein
VREPEAERGFTLIELMMVVAIIAVLAVIVVPLFTRESKRTKGQSEINPMFAELATREDQYRTENNVYLDTTLCPATTSNTGTDSATCLTSGSPWTLLRVSPSEKMLKCTYDVTVGASTDDPSASLPTWVAAISGFSAPTLATAWYFIEAVCPYNKYFIASWDTKIRSEDGH